MKKIITLSLFVISFSFLSSCSQLSKDVWPEGAPPQTIYSDHYSGSVDLHSLQSEEDYLMWVTRFYEGFNILPGWSDITVKVMEDVQASESDLMAQKMYELGKKISLEWAKDNNIRLINSKMANTWREAFLESIEVNDLMNFVYMLEADVEALLLSSLDGDEIYFERYYEDSFEF